MKIYATKTATFLVLCLVIFVGLPLKAAMSTDSGLGFGLRVAGSYLIENLDIPLAGQADLQALATLTAHGGAIATDSDDFGLAATAPHSPKHGARGKSL